MARQVCIKPTWTDRSLLIDVSTFIRSEGCSTPLLSLLQMRTQFYQQGTEATHSSPHERSPLPGISMLSALLHIVPDFSLTCRDQLFIEVRMRCHCAFSSLVLVCLSLLT